MYDEYGREVQVPPQQSYPDPEQMALRSAIANMSQEMQKLQTKLDESEVDAQERRISGLIQRGYDKYPNMREEEIYYNILRYPDHDALTDKQIMDMCAASHRRQTEAMDAYVTNYLDKKKQTEANRPPTMAPHGTPPSPPDKPISSFDEALKAAQEYMKNTT